MELAVAWGVIETWLAAHAPAVRKSLRPPSDDVKVERLQKKLRLTLPADFVASVLIHDGQKSEAEHGLFPAPADVLPEPSYRLFTLTDVAREWAMMKELHDIGQFEGARKPKPARGIQNVVWSLGWVPIADNGAGDYFCLDLAPAKGGTVGQVILFGHENTDQRRVARSFAEWMGKLARRFQTGKIVLDEDEGLVEA
jgi:cell wall assembly regulator SMI1